MDESTKKRIVIVTLIALGLKVFWISGSDNVEFLEVFLFVFFFLINWGWVSALLMAVFSTSDDGSSQIAIYSAAVFAFFAAVGMSDPSYDDSLHSDNCRSTIHIEDCG